MTGWHGFALSAVALPLAIALPSPGAAQDGEGPHPSHPNPAEVGPHDWLNRAIFVGKFRSFSAEPPELVLDFHRVA